MEQELPTKKIRQTTWRENEQTDQQIIDRILQENISRGDSLLLRRLFPFHEAQTIRWDVFASCLQCISQSDSQAPIAERVRLFRSALEYFSEEKKEEQLEYPVGHATGSDALRLIIQTGKIKGGGTGEHGESVSFSYGGKQKEVSVAEMKHGLADWVGLFYARMASSSQLVKKDLLINADEIGGKRYVEDVMDTFLDNTSLDQILALFASRLNREATEIRTIVARESEKKPSEITRGDIRRSSLLGSIIASDLKDFADRKHYRTADSERRDFEALTYIIAQCEQGEFPSVTYAGRTYQDPEEVLGIDHVVRQPRNAQEKILIDLQNQYAYYLRSATNQKGERREPFYTPEEFRAKKTELLGEIAAYLKRPGSQYDKLLHPKAADTEEEKQRKQERLTQLANQFPCMLIVEGKAYQQNGATFSQVYGRRPVDFFEVEEQILTDIAFSDVTEIIVPQKRMAKVRQWLAAQGEGNNHVPALIPFEYFEIKRLLNQELKKTEAVK